MGRDGPDGDGRWDHDGNWDNDWKKQENEERIRSCIYFIILSFILIS